MERIKDLRSVTLPDGNLARRDVQSQLISVPTGKFTRNCVLTGKASPDMEFPLYIRTPGLVSPIGGLSPQGLGYIDASEGVATNAFPTHKALTNDSNYWEAQNIGCWIAYHHELRPTMIRGYRLITENGYTPRVWRVEGSNDNVTWTTLHSVTVDWTWGYGKQIVEEAIPSENRDYFMHHRLIVDEFDATAIRIYYFQFWDSTCPSAADFYLDADATDPVQLAFADGYHADGTPKDILFTINTGVDIDITSFLPEIDMINGDNPYACILWAEYDPDVSAVSFHAEHAYSDIPIPPYIHGWVPLASSFYSGSFNEIFDDDVSSYANMNRYSSCTVEIANPFYASAIYGRGSSSYYIKCQISEDYGITWSETFTLPSNLGVVYLPRIYYVTCLKISNPGQGRARVYFFRFLNTYAARYKMSEGKIYQLNEDLQTWDQVYKLPLGYLTLWRNHDNTAWEIDNFIPTHIPQMSIAPYFRKTSGGLAL